MYPLEFHGKIGIIGASGFLGSRLFDDLSKYTEVVGTYFSKSMPDLVHLDIRKEEQVKSFWRNYKPEVLFIPGGITYPDKCEKNKKEAFQVNVKGVTNITKICECKIVYFSTDYVFDGERGHYHEYDLPTPINYYGWTKYEAEKIILKSENNVVLRVSGLYGLSERNNEFVRSLKNNLVSYKADDCYSCNLLLDDLINNIGFSLDKNGLFHFTDEISMSRYEFTLKALEVLNIESKIIPKHSSEIYNIAKRPKNSSMFSKRHSLKLHKPEEGLNYLKQLLYTV